MADDLRGTLSQLRLRELLTEVQERVEQMLTGRDRLDGLVEAIRHVHSGDAVVAPSTTRRLLDHFARSRPEAPFARGYRTRNRLAHLTPREDEVLQLVAQGLSNAEIAARLFVAETTVKTHVRRILTKLDLRDRVQAVVLAYESGIVRPH